MKAIISASGHLVLAAETQTELFALRQWHKRGNGAMKLILDRPVNEAEAQIMDRTGLSIEEDDEQDDPDPHKISKEEILLAEERTRESRMEVREERRFRG